MQNHSASTLAPLPDGLRAPIFLADIPSPAPVFGYDGSRLGHGRALALDQASGHSLCLLVGRGRRVRRLRPIPWAALRYDARRRAFLADVSAELFLHGPVWPGVGAQAQACVRRAHLYYDVYHDRQGDD